MAGIATGAMVMGGIKGLAGIAGGIIGSKKRKEELRKAQNEYNRTKQNLMNRDTSNLYANQENVYEDLTVNTQQAEFAAEQQQQALANTMGNMQGAAGGSGIAALAQTMANQQSKNLAAASISIGQQEQQNQMAERGMASQLNQQEIAGEYQSREDKEEKMREQFGMAQQRLGAAKAAKQAATQSIIGGVTGIASSVIPQMEIFGGSGFGQG
jgi:hypothetical protein